MNTTQVSVDLAKSVFQVAVSHSPGRVHEQHRLSRAGFMRFFAGHEPVEVLLEACGSAHYWGRELEKMSHHVSLLPPADVSRYRDGSKTDRADAKALLEAARNRAIDPVRSSLSSNKRSPRFTGSGLAISSGQFFPSYPMALRDSPAWPEGGFHVFRRPANALGCERSLLIITLLPHSTMEPWKRPDLISLGSQPGNSSSPS